MLLELRTDFGLVAINHRDETRYDLIPNKSGKYDHLVPLQPIGLVRANHQGLFQKVSDEFNQENLPRTEDGKLPNLYFMLNHGHINPRFDINGVPMVTDITALVNQMQMQLQFYHFPPEMMYNSQDIYDAQRSEDKKQIRTFAGTVVNLEE